MTSRDAFHEFARAHPDAELWWDSHPELHTGAATAAWRPAAPGSLARGVTTNPMLLLAYLRSRGPRRAALRAIADRADTADASRLADLLQDDCVASAAGALRPLFEASDGRFGWVSAQVPPRCFDHAADMWEHALRLAAIASNVMVKVPACADGLVVAERLAADGISVNCTLSYSVAQARACLLALERGRARAPRARPWRAVVTYMAGRFGDELREQAAREGVRLAPGDVRWAEITNAVRQLELLRESSHAVKLLVCSLRCDDMPDAIDGSVCAHLEHLTGRPVIVSCPPQLIAEVLLRGGASAGRGSRAPAAPDSVLGRLEALSWMRDGAGDATIALEDFAQLPAFRKNRLQHEAAERQLHELASGVLENVS